jgi:hypothetical protein
MPLDSTPGYCTVLSAVTQAYNEAAFRHFLAVDRRRAARSARSLLLVLATVRTGADRGDILTDSTAAVLFEGLRASVREVDFVGWYRTGRVAAAVLTQGAKAADVAPRLIEDRMLGALKKRLPADQEQHLRVRVVRLGGRVRV